MVPIAYHAATGGASGVDFTNIPQIYQDLMIVQDIRSARAATTEQFWQRLNNDAGSNYSYTYFRSDGTTISSARLTSQTVANRFEIPAASSEASIFNSSIVHILDYANTSRFKTILVRSSSDLGSPSGIVTLSVGLWRNTNGITSVNVATENGSNLVGGSTIALYGIKAGV
jgi:hypothetical protein